MPTTVVRTASQMATKTTISPKVLVPAVAQAVAGVVLIVLGAVPSIVDDSGTRSTLLTLGLALVGASGLTGGLGYQAQPGQVTVRE
jgi:hypothetical protein